MTDFATRPANLGPILVVALLGLVAPSARAQPPRPAPPTIAWKSDYNSARKEANEKGLPLLIILGTDNCFYCRKLESTTLRHPDVIAMLGDGFVALKVDAHREPALAKALKVQLYPTIVLAGNDGKIHSFIEGYVETERLTEHMKRAGAANSTTEWMARDFNEASKAIGIGDYPRAVTLLRGLTKGAGDRPVGIKAREVLDSVERQAESQLVRARDLERKGYTPEAMDAMAELVKVYAGTQAASEAANLMAGLADKPENRDRQQARIARDLLAMAKDEFRRGHFYECLQKCEQLTVGFPDRSESKEASSLAGEINNSPDQLARACEQMNERTAAMYLTLAESWSKKGQNAEAKVCLEKVMKLTPNSRQAEFAQAQLTKLQGRTPAQPAVFEKP